MATPTPVSIRLTVAMRRAHDAGHAWPDIATIALARLGSEDRATRTHALMPPWAAANPVVRIALATMTREGEAL